MKKGQFSEEQMVAILREADKSPVAEVAKKHKISEQTIYSWRRHFGTLEPVDVKRLRGLEAENATLKRMLAERDLEIPSEQWRLARVRRYRGRFAAAPRVP